MEENISRMAGSRHGVRLEADQLIAAAHEAGRHAARRDTTYRILDFHTHPDGCLEDPVQAMLAGAAA